MLSCEKAQLTTEDTPTDQRQTKQVTFVMEGITETYSTRATIQSAGCTDLWVFEDTTLLCHQQSSDSNFGLPSVTLAYGAHDLTFIASASEGQAWRDSLWTCTKVKDTFAKQMSVTVSSTSAKSRQVALTRRNSKVMFTTTDPVPSSVSKVHINVGTRLSLRADLTASDSISYEATVSVVSKQGSTTTNYVNILAQSPTDEEPCSFLIRWLSSTDAVLYQYQRTLQVKANRATNLKGAFFSSSSSESHSISVSTDWDTQVDVAL